MNMKKKRKISFVISCVMAITAIFSGCSSISEEMPESVSASSVQEESLAKETAYESKTSSNEEIIEPEALTQVSEITSEETQTFSVSESYETTLASKLNNTEKADFETVTESETEKSTETKTSSESDSWSETKIGDTVLYVTQDCVGRDTASDDGNAVTKYAKGEVLTVNALTDSGFYKLRDENEYIHTFYLSDYPVVTETSQTTTIETSVESQTTSETTSVSKTDTNDNSSSSVTDEDYKNGYAYKTLSSDEQTLYSSIVSAVNNFENNVAVPDGMSKTDAFKVFVTVFYEEPQFFWLNDEFSINGNIITLKYKTSRSNVKNMQEEIDANVSPLLAKINAASSDYEKLKLMYDYIVLHNDFSLDTSGYNMSIYNAFTSNGELQCAGYAKSIKYLCDKAGIEAVAVIGKNSAGESHAWDVVKCSGKYYNLDATWGDPMDPSNGKIDYNSDYIRYTYFLVPDSIIHDISHFHVNEMETKSYGTIKLFTPPAANSETYNYFRQEGLYFKNVDDADAAVKAQIEKAVSNKFQGVQVRVSADIFSEAFSDKKVLEYQKYAMSLSNNVSKILYYRTETYKKTGIITIDIVYK